MKPDILGIKLVVEYNLSDSSITLTQVLHKDSPIFSIQTEGDNDKDEARFDDIEQFEEILNDFKNKLRNVPL